MDKEKPNYDFDLPTNGLNDVLYALGNFESCSTKDVPVVVEDENGRIEHIKHIWYDPVRDMVRISIGDVNFVDAD